MVSHFTPTPTGNSMIGKGNVAATLDEMRGVVPQATAELATAMAEESTLDRPMTARQKKEMDAIIRNACAVLQGIHLSKKRGQTHGANEQGERGKRVHARQGRKYLAAATY